MEVEIHFKDAGHTVVDRSVATAYVYEGMYCLVDMDDSGIITKYPMVNVLYVVERYGTGNDELVKTLMEQ